MTNLIRHTYKDIPIIIGGIEASLRRLAHYDYWSNKVKRSILLDSGADLISCGMGERSIVEIADALSAGIAVKDITFVDGTIFKTKDRELISDAVYALPYMRTYHPSYEKEGGVPAIKEVKFSLISNRGCYGGCNICALTFHQGRIVQTRSHESILEDAKKIIEDPEFKGYIHDVGGPTANFRAPACSKQMTKGACPNKQCLFPQPCKNLEVDHRDYVALLRKLRELPKVKKYLCVPESALKEAIELAEYLRDHKLSPEQVQDFYPTPSTISTCMYYTGLDPKTLEPVYVATNPHGKAMHGRKLHF